MVASNKDKTDKSKTLKETLKETGLTEEQHHCSGNHQHGKNSKNSEQCCKDKKQDVEDDVHQLKEINLALLAEMENNRKRVAKEVADQAKFNLSTIIYDILDPLDNLERARKAVSQGDIAESPKAVANVMIGLDMVIKQFYDLLEKHGAQKIDIQIGSKYDSDTQEIFEQLEDKDKKIKSNSVIKIVRSGYKLHQRLVRPALVVIKK